MFSKDPVVQVGLWQYDNEVSAFCVIAETDFLLANCIMALSKKFESLLSESA